MTTTPQTMTHDPTHAALLRAFKAARRWIEARDRYGANRNPDTAAACDHAKQEYDIAVSKYDAIIEEQTGHVRSRTR